MRALVSLLALVFVHTGSIPGARADEGLASDKANALFREGKRLSEEDRWGEACERFEQSLKYADGIGTRFNLADCWEHVGRTASAQALFVEVATAARNAGQPEREQAARERAAALEPRLARLVIEVRATEGQSITVRRNRSPVDPKSFGQALPVDPGTQEIEATAPGKMRWLSSVQVPSSASTVWVTIPGLLDAAKPASAVAPLAHEPKPGRALAQETPRDLRALSIGLAAFGVAGVAAGTAFALKYRSFDEEADGICPSLTAPCAPADLERRDALDEDAEAAQVGAFVAFGVGGAALIGAALSHFVFDTRGKLKAPQNGMNFIPQVGAGQVGLVGSGSF